MSGPKGEGRGMDSLEEYSTDDKGGGKVLWCPGGKIKERWRPPYPQVAVAVQLRWTSSLSCLEEGRGEGREGASQDVPARTIILDASVAWRCVEEGRKATKMWMPQSFWQMTGKWSMIEPLKRLHRRMATQPSTASTSPTGKEDTLGLHVICKGLWRWLSVEQDDADDFASTTSWHLVWYRESTEYNVQ